MGDHDHDQQPADLEDPLRRLAATVDRVERWVADHGGRAREHGIDRSTYDVALPAAQALPELRALRAEGHEASVTYERPGFLRVVHLRASGEVVAPGKEGSWDDAGLPPQRVEAVEAAERQGAWKLLAALGDERIEAAIDLLNIADESGFHWIRERAALLAELGGGRWLPLLAAAPPVPERARLVVHDLPDGWVSARGICVHGRGVDPARLPAVLPPVPAVVETEDAVPDAKVVDQAARYAAEWLDADRRDLPAPFLLEPIGCEPGEADPGFAPSIEAFLHRAAQALVWIWLAETAALDTSGVRFAWQGAAEVLLGDLDQSPFKPEPERTREAIRLWKMAVATEDDLRHESVHQAIEAIVRAPDDLAKAAAPVRRRARFVLKIAEENRTGEAMATLRAARRAAVDAAGAIAAATRGAARGVVDRVFTSVVAALGVLLANKANLVNDTVAGWLLGAVALVVTATWVIAWFVEYPDAKALHKAATGDLERYGDLLDQTELEELTAGSLAAAEKQLERSKALSTWIAFGGMLIALALLGLVLAAA